MLTSFSSRLRAQRLTPKQLGSLLAALATLTLSGCSHLPSLPSLSAINPFAFAGTADLKQEPLVVESVAVQGEASQAVQDSVSAAPSVRTDDTTQQAPSALENLVAELKQPAPATIQPWAHLGKLSDSRRALAKRLRAQNQVASNHPAARAVVLGETQGVLDLPPTYWAVQVAAVRNIERIAQMVKDNQLEGMLGVPMRTEAGPLHAVLTGVYVSREDAQAGAANLPAVLAGYKPWVRPLAHLQAAMR